MSTPLLRHVRSLARYNHWAHERLLKACSDLPEEEYLKDRPAFFGSIHRTLNHIVVCDRLWLARITGDKDSEVKNLDDVPHPDLKSLKAGQREQSSRLISLVDTLEEAQLTGEIVYTTSKGDEQRQPLLQILTHLTNHATHHRGQVHDMLTQVPVDPPPLDYVYYLREEAKAG